LFVRGRVSIYRCRNTGCRHSFCHPQPDDEQLARFYGKDYYGSGNPLYGQTQRSIFRQILQWLPDVRGPFLDVGCGEGFFFEVLPFASRQYYKGVETDKAAREKAQKRTGCHIAESLEALSTMDQVFKIIVLNQVIEHFRNPLDSLKMIGHISSRDAVLLTATANSTSLKARIKGSNWDQLQNRTHLHLFTKKSLILTLQKSGWQNVIIIVDTIRYPHHGTFRSFVHRVLRKTGLDGNLTLIAGK
jgi:SAM-dependent methyltransferase